MRTPAAGCFAGVTGSIRAVGCQAARCLSGHLVLARHIDSPRFLRIQELSPHNVVHTFRLTSPADVDAEFVTWLVEAYRVGGQEHLKR